MTQQNDERKPNVKPPKATISVVSEKCVKSPQKSPENVKNTPENAQKNVKSHIMAQKKKPVKKSERKRRC